MSKKTILAVAVATLALGQVAKAQTNVQVFYDFATDRQHVTTTVEGFYGDNWGNTFFFVDHDFNSRDVKRIPLRFCYRLTQLKKSRRVWAFCRRSEETHKTAFYRPVNASR